MKIGGIKEAVRFLNQVQERRERPQQEGGGGSSDPEKEKKDRKEEFQEMFKRLTAAVENFGKESQTQTSGLQAFLEGDAGPGLRVVLKDSFGKVIRQMTGEEFLKLRDATFVGEHASPGKILDQRY